MSLNVSRQIRSLLRDGPITSKDVEMELGITARKAHIAIWVLLHRKHIKATGIMPSLGKVGHPLKIYSLTPHGQAQARIDRSLTRA